MIVAFHQQVYRLFAILHAARGVDAWPDFEDDIAHGQFTSAEPTHLDDGFQTHRRILVELFQAMEGQCAILTRHRNDIGGDAHHAEVEQGNQA